MGQKKNGKEFKEYFAIIYEFTDKLYLEDPIQWKIDNGLLDPNVNAKLEITSMPSVIEWDYLEFERGQSKSGYLVLDGTKSTAGFGISNYMFNVMAGSQSDTKNNSSGIYSNVFYFTPDDIISNRIPITAFLTATDTRGTTGTATATGTISVDIVNEKPSAYFTLNPSDYYYATRNIAITDRSSDPEDDMATVNWWITTSTGNTIFMAFFSGDEKEPYL